MTWLGGYGLFATNAAWRARYNLAVAEWPLLPQVPEHWSIWWIVAPLALWIFVAVLHREVRRQNNAAKIEFGEPYSETFFLEGLGADRRELERSQICMAKIHLRNHPANMAEAAAVTEAYVVAEFYEGNKKLFSVKYPRWTDNKKPRLDEMDKPKFTSELNFRNLPGNKVEHCIDFAFKFISEDEMFGFRGQSQNSNWWKESEFCLKKAEYRVRLLVYGIGLEKAAEQWVIVKNAGKGNPLTVESQESADARNWVGVG